MIDEPRIIPECYGDTLWANLILEKKVQHAYGSGAANAMIKFPKRLAIGIIDDDKKKPTYFKDFKVIEESDGFKFCRKINTKHYLIIIKPAIEAWLLDMATKGNVSHNYNLNTLKKAMKSINADKDNNLKTFLNTLKQKDIKGVNDYRRCLRDLTGD